MQNNNVELNIFLGSKHNKPQLSEYTDLSHDGDVYIEGRAGSNFEIEIYNKNSFQIEAVVSVDGLSVTDGLSAGEKSFGYIVQPYDRIRIPGWRRNGQNAACFEFVGKNSAYATHVNAGSSNNSGVIGLKVFKRKPETKQYVPVPYLYPVPYTPLPYIPQPLSPYSPWNQPFNGYPYNMNYISSYGDLPHDGWGSDTLSVGGGAPSTGLSQLTQLSVCTNSVSTAGSNGVVSASSSIGSGGVSRGFAKSSNTFTTSDSYYNQASTEQALGTGYGKEVSFKTENVDWNRGDLLTTIAIYYDDLRGLKSRGIVVPRNQPQPKTKPLAFPADVGCKAPPNWRG
jgi:hypothetical protein